MRVVVCQSCHNKTPQTGWLRQQKHPGSGGWEVQEQSADESGFLLRATVEGPAQASPFGMQMATFLLPLHTVISLDMDTPGSLPLLTRTQVLVN